jgi:uncharacterized UPF0160 family protein
VQNGAQILCNNTPAIKLAFVILIRDPKTNQTHDQKYYRAIERSDAPVENSIERLVPKSSGYEDVRNSLQKSNTQKTKNKTTTTTT